MLTPCSSLRKPMQLDYTINSTARSTHVVCVTVYKTSGCGVHVHVYVHVGLATVYNGLPFGVEAAFKSLDVCRTTPSKKSGSALICTAALLWKK